jgi:translin
MYKLESIAERIRQNFEVRTAKRDEALKIARQLTRACSLAIRGVHRDDMEAMTAYLAEAQNLLHP